jgi:hypothetical protein
MRSKSIFADEKSRRGSPDVHRETLLGADSTNQASIERSHNNGRKSDNDIKSKRHPVKVDNVLSKRGQYNRWNVQLRHGFDGNKGDTHVNLRHGEKRRGLTHVRDAIKGSTAMDHYGRSQKKKKKKVFMSIFVKGHMQ